MRIFAIADPHLSQVNPKPMGIFGTGWEGHPQAFFEGWQQTVSPDDLVIVPGDISWAMHLDEALPDLKAIAELPGRKVLLRGNHDYWWSSIQKLRQALPPGMWALQNDSVVINRVAVAGTRGWEVPGSRELSPEDQKIYLREVERLRLSLESLAHQTFDRLVLALHYPPVGSGGEATGFSQLIERYRPDCVVYGHLHGPEQKRHPTHWQGIPLHLVAADHLHFVPRLVGQVD
jgi:predicted phosphohydrolase